MFDEIVPQDIADVDDEDDGGDDNEGSKSELEDGVKIPFGIISLLHMLVGEADDDEHRIWEYVLELIKLKSSKKPLISPNHISNVPFTKDNKIKIADYYYHSVDAFTFNLTHSEKWSH